LTMRSDEREYSGWLMELRDSNGYILSSTECNSEVDCDEGITVPVGVSSAGNYTLIVSSESEYFKPDGLYTLLATYSE
jgi:hypothetical protein